jgi:hypothetical protein
MRGHVAPKCAVTLPKRPVTMGRNTQLLRREGLSAQRIRTWKTSKDPRFDAKKNASAGSTAAARSAPR